MRKCPLPWFFFSSLFSGKNDLRSRDTHSYSQVWLPRLNAKARGVFHNRKLSWKNAAQKTAEPTRESGSTIIAEPEFPRQYIQAISNPNQDSTAPERNSDYLQPISPDSEYATIDDRVIGSGPQSPELDTRSSPDHMDSGKHAPAYENTASDKPAPAYKNTTMTPPSTYETLDESTREKIYTQLN